MILDLCTHLLLALMDVRKPSVLVAGSISWEGDPGLCKEDKENCPLDRAFAAICFPVLDVMLAAISSSCCLDPQARMG